MKVSLAWVKLLNDKYSSSANPAPEGIDALVEKIGAQLGAVEEVVNLGERYKGILVAKVISCEKHPDADKLSVCLLDDGGVEKRVKRNKQSLVEVVCGAPNVKAGQLVAWIPPGVTVPSTYDKDPFVLEARELRGVVSNGMIASARELALGDSHEGILEIDKDVKPGTAFADVYDLNDYIIDIENKMFTHRPDLFGILGVAREIAGIQNHVFKSPAWYRENAGIPIDGRGSSLKLEVKNEVPKLVPRFCAIVIKDIEVKPSPIWLQSYLSRVGIRPINNIVDLTNYYMYETAQPLHAYDYDKLKTGVLGARLSQKGEEITLLGGKKLKLDSGALVITDGKKPIGLGGVMGGGETEVGPLTKNIVIECANFDMNATRKSAMTYGLFTDAATRFTKNQSPRQNMPVLAQIVAHILKPEYSGGRIASKVIDINKAKSVLVPVKASTLFVNERLGLNLTAAQMKKILENVEFKVSISGTSLSVTVPFWRTDIEIPEDIVEEVGRLYGYDQLPLVLPPRDLAPAKLNSAIVFQTVLRRAMMIAGASEALTYSFVHGDLLSKAGQDAKIAYRLRNALSPDLQYYRLSLTPSLLEKIHPNIKLGYDKFALFELGKVHGKTEIDAHGLPKEFNRLALVLASNKKQDDASFFWAKEYASYLFRRLGLQANYQSLEGFSTKGHKLFEQMLAPFEPKRSAAVFVGDKLEGVVGEYKASVTEQFKLPARSSGFELFLSALQSEGKKAYQPLNRFPSLDQDLCLRTKLGLSYQELTGFIEDNLAELSQVHGYNFSIRPLDIFQKPDDKDHKQTTWRITLWHAERTLATKETNKLLLELSARAKAKLGAERI